MFVIPVVRGIGLKKSFLGNMCIDYCKLCIWGQIVVKSQKMCKNMDLEVFEVFSAEKPHFWLKNLNCRCMNSYGEIIGPSLTCGIKRAMICEIFVVNLRNSCVVLYWPVSKVLHKFCSSGHPSPWNLTQEKSPNKYVIWLL